MLGRVLTKLSGSSGLRRSFKWLTARAREFLRASQMVRGSRFQSAGFGSLRNDISTSTVPETSGGKATLPRPASDSSAVGAIPWPVSATCGVLEGDVDDVPGAAEVGTGALPAVSILRIA